jgi:hypothetical protein
VHSSFQTHRRSRFQNTGTHWYRIPPPTIPLSTQCVFGFNGSWEHRGLAVAKIQIFYSTLLRKASSSRASLLQSRIAEFHSSSESESTTVLSVAIPNHTSRNLRHQGICHCSYRVLSENGVTRYVFI